MSSKKQEMVRDDYGYINNRGKSKYWGVTTGMDSNGRDYWCASIHPKDGTQTRTYRAIWCSRPSEIDMARFAAMVYDLKGKILGTKVLTADRKYVMSSGNDGGYIYRELYTNQVVHQFQPQLTLDYTPAEQVVVTPAKVAVTASNSALLEDARKGVFLELVKMVTSVKLTTQETSTLIAALEAA